MRVMIVEDEPFYIEQFKRKLAVVGDELGLDIAIVAECYDGREALETITQAAPDAVFTDIRMTSLDGIELAKALRESHPELPVVIVSAYPSFDYLREAMREGVVEYLLKPVDMQALRAIVEKLAAGMQSRSERLARDCLLALLASARPDEAVVLAARRALQHPYYRALLIRKADSAYEYPVLAPSSEEDNAKLFRALAPLLNGQPCWLFPLDDGRLQLLVAAMQDSGDSRLTQLLDVVCDHYAADGQKPSVIYSDAFADISGLSRLVPALRSAMTDRAIIGKSVRAAVSERAQPVPAPYTDVERAKLDKLLAAGDHAGASAFIAELFRGWELAACPTRALGKRMKDILLSIERHEAGTGRLEPIDGEARIDELLHTSKSFAELAEGFLSMLSLVYGWDSDNLDGGDFKRLFARIETYIASHIGQSLSLPLLTQHFHVSKTLLCNLFRDYTGKSFVEYVTTFRMHKAQELMRLYPRMRNKEIAEMVGYPDQNYFSRVFTSVIGMSPSDFRSRVAASGE